MNLDRPSPFFVGDHPAIDFLNTIAMPDGEEIDWLLDAEDLIGWLCLVGMIDSDNADKMRKCNPSKLKKVGQEAREFRAWLRSFVTARMGKALRTTAPMIAPLNELLARDNSYTRIELSNAVKGEKQEAALVRTPRWETPEEMLQPIALAAADLICQQDFELIRSCEGAGCILIFLDRTRAHSRRWCSMAVCGNRAKVAAHRAKNASK